MSEIPKAYEPQAVEAKWYQFWLDQKCFVADAHSPKPAYSIVIPPPNVTGMLHMGHVLNNTIQDILSRKARMDGKEVLWLPGTDHAGIATQVQVEKALKKEERKTKHDLGREEFLKRVWQWKEKHGDIIIQQLKKLGCSCDWTRERFTMDPEYSRCVQKVFVELYRKGLIYRGKRMVNWCPATLTALSDEEVDMEPQKGWLWYFKVEVAEEPGTFLTIATTRPETIPGDTGVAVNPKDPRYARLIGQHVIRPLPSELPREQKLMPIVGDDHIDPEFGTGVLKVTPAHDKADFDIGQRHNLPAVDIMNPNGSLNELAGKDLAGLDRFEARKVAVEKLKEHGAWVKEEPYENKVGFSQRARVPIEPRLSEQWFLKYPAVEQSRACVGQEEGSAEHRLGADANEDARRDGARRSGTMRFHPQRWAKVYDHWLSNIQDWCISRQLWWGHRIPVWTLVWNDECAGGAIEEEEFSRGFDAWVKEAGLVGKLEIRIVRDMPFTARIVTLDPEADAHLAELAEHAKKRDEQAASEYEARFTTEAQILYAIDTLTQDPDVLDTWFSSWLWPFATMGWTGDKSQDANTPTLQKFYPTTDLVTGPDIIFFWVARMIMAGYEFMGGMPFRNVYFTGIIRDKQGRKMSKTLGNSPDPLDLIGRYGADALRFGTMRSAPLGQDVLFDEKDVELGRNFCNKLWNACRFRQLQGGETQGELDPRLLTSDDKWILLKLDQAIREITSALAGYKFSEATAALHRFFWSEYCDWYVEASKATLSRPVEPAVDSTRQRVSDSTDEARRANTLAVIDFVLSHTLRLFHPFLPFITEELWHGMGYADDMPENQGGRTIMTAPWPQPLDDDFKTHYGLTGGDEQRVDARNEFVVQGRNLRRTGNISASKKVKFIFKPAAAGAAHDLEVMKLLLNAEAIEVNPGYQPGKGAPTVRADLGELCLPLEGLVDVAAEKARLTKDLERIESEIMKAEQKLANPSFTQKAPPQVLEEHRKRLAEWNSKRDHARTALEALSG
jgi:valyl-tRNA synthetase